MPLICEVVTRFLHRGATSDAKSLQEIFHNILIVLGYQSLAISSVNFQLWMHDFFPLFYFLVACSLLCSKCVLCVCAHAHACGGKKLVPGVFLPCTVRQGHLLNVELTSG